MKILIFGGEGQVGWALRQACAPLGFIKAFGHREVDFEALDAVKACVCRENPDVIINAAAYTAVDQAEKEPEKAFRINAEAVEVLAQEAKACQAVFIHYSTDYVFDGRKTDAYLETDSTNPLSVYGSSKRAGEEAVLKTGSGLIFRTGWVYGHGVPCFINSQNKPRNFLTTMLKLGQEKDQLSIVSDQYGAPTSASLIAEITAFALYRKLQDKQKAFNGLYHLTAKGKTDWHAYAVFLFKEVLALTEKLGAENSRIQLKIHPDSVQEISTDAYPVLAVRPKYSVLNTGKLMRDFALSLPDWQNSVRRILYEILF